MLKKIMLLLASILVGGSVIAGCGTDKDIEKETTTSYEFSAIEVDEKIYNDEKCSISFLGILDNKDLSNLYELGDVERVADGLFLLFDVQNKTDDGKDIEVYADSINVNSKNAKPQGVIIAEDGQNGSDVLSVMFKDLYIDKKSDVKNISFALRIKNEDGLIAHTLEKRFEFDNGMLVSVKDVVPSSTATAQATTSEPTTTTIEPSTTEPTTTTMEAPQETNVVLLDDKVVKVEYVNCYEESYLPGVCYVQLKVTNKTDREITVGISETYANDTSVFMGSGVPMTLAPGKNSQTPFFFWYENAGIASLSDIKKIETSLMIFDEGTNVIETTPILTINL